MRNRDDIIHIRILRKKFRLDLLYRIFNCCRDTLHSSADAKNVFGAYRTVVVDIAFKRESLQGRRSCPGSLMDRKLIESRSLRQREKAFMNPAAGRNLRFERIQSSRHNEWPLLLPESL